MAIFGGIEGWFRGCADSANLDGVPARASATVEEEIRVEGGAGGQTSNRHAITRCYTAARRR